MDTKSSIKSAVSSVAVSATTMRRHWSPSNISNHPNPTLDRRSLCSTTGVPQSSDCRSFANRGLESFTPDAISFTTDTTDNPAALAKATIRSNGLDLACMWIPEHRQPLCL
jgi:hypothetical protein